MEIALFKTFPITGMNPRTSPGPKFRSLERGIKPSNAPSVVGIVPCPPPAVTVQRQAGTNSTQAESRTNKNKFSNTYLRYILNIEIVSLARDILYKSTLIYFLNMTIIKYTWACQKHCFVVQKPARFNRNSQPQAIDRESE